MSRAQAAKEREENEIELSRIVAFSDGVFAIAITLLVLNLGVPGHIRRAGLSRISVEDAKGGQRSAFIVAAVFMASIPVALLDPHLAPYCWLALFVGPVIVQIGKARSQV